MIELRKVTKEYSKGNAALNGISVKIERGEFVFIVGDSGSGKSTLIKLIMKELSPTEGTIIVNGQNLNRMKHRNIAKYRRGLGVVFQDFQLLMDRTVYENLRFVLRATGWKDRAAISERIRKVLAAVGMEHKADSMPHQLSGGEQQRIAIARALLNSPEIILADEPTGNLDGDTAREIMDLLVRINRERGPVVIMVTHNRSLFEQYPARTFLCEKLSCTEVPEESDVELDLSEFI